MIRQLRFFESDSLDPYYNLTEGRIIFGNAFYQNGLRAYHHGTLMIDVDQEKLERYLSPSRAKLETKGVASVRSRALCELLEKQEI